MNRHARDGVLAAERHHAEVLQQRIDRADENDAIAQRFEEFFGEFLLLRRAVFRRLAEGDDIDDA